MSADFASGTVIMVPPRSTSAGAGFSGSSLFIFFILIHDDDQIVIKGCVVPEDFNLLGTFLYLRDKLVSPLQVSLQHVELLIDAALKHVSLALKLCIPS